MFATDPTRGAFTTGRRVEVTNAHFGTARAAATASSLLLPPASPFAGQHGRRSRHTGTAVDWRHGILFQAAQRVAASRRCRRLLGRCWIGHHRIAVLVQRMERMQSNSGIACNTIPFNLFRWKIETIDGADTFSCKLDVRITLLVQFYVVVEYTDSTYSGPDTFSFSTLPLFLFGGPFSFTSQSQFLISLLPHELIGTDWMLFAQPYVKHKKLLVSYVSIEWNEPNEPSLMLLFNKGKLLVLLLGGSGRRCMKCILCRCGSLSNGGRGALLGGGAGDGGGGGCCCCCWWLFNMGERCKSLRSIGRSKVCVNMAKLKHLTVKMNEQNNLPWKRHLHWRLNSSDAALVARRRDL